MAPFSLCHSENAVFLRANTGAQGYVHAFSTRRGGVSTGVYSSLNLGFFSEDEGDAVQGNWQRLLQACSLASRPMCYLNQEHGTGLVRVDETVVSSAPTCMGGYDALWTTRRDVVLGIVTADCVPVLVHGSGETPFVAGIHCGWRGLAAGIVPMVLASIARVHPFDPSELSLLLGPSIGSCCYEVGDDVACAFHKGRKGDTDGLVASGAGKWKLDMVAILRSQASSIGVPLDQILICDMCTCCHEEMFFSYRRSCGMDRGRMGAVISLSEV